MKLTKAQTEYALERADQLYAKKLSAARAKFEPVPDFNKWREEQVRSGKATLKPNVPRHKYWPDAFIYKDEDKILKKIKKAEQDNARLVENAKAEYGPQLTALKDQLMLGGDADEALKALEAFAKS